MDRRYQLSRPVLAGSAGKELSPQHTCCKARDYTPTQPMRKAGKPCFAVDRVAVAGISLAVNWGP